MDRTYDAILFRQRPHSPLQVAFAAPSSEISEWARVPTKKTGNIRNFQRAELPKHIQEVEVFFGDDANASPTAVVVGFDPVRAKGRVQTLTAAGEPLDESTVVAGVPQAGKIAITWDASGVPVQREALLAAFQTKITRLREVVFTDLRDITALSDAALDEILGFLSQSILEGRELEPEAENLSQPELEPEPELPTELRTKLVGLSPSEQQVIVGRLLFLASCNADALSSKPDKYLEDLFLELCDELKPGLLIDGQHRINGTKKLANIPFLVTALPTAAWPELAFQFIVTNRTAKRVPESLLISIIGNSLSKKQRGDIEERLRKANIRVGLIEAVMRTHEDESSPFYGLISFGIKGDKKGFLDAAAFRGKVIQPWYERLSPILELFDHMCEGKKKSDRTEYWKDEELWFKYFVSFWSVVRERYEGTTVFSSEVVDGKPVSALMFATVLMIFQDTILGYLLTGLQEKENIEGVSVAHSLQTEADFAEKVKNSIKRLTPDFFLEWKITGFDGSRGAKEDLASAILSVIKGTTVAKLKRDGHRLYNPAGQKKA